MKIVVLWHLGWEGTMVKITITTSQQCWECCTDILCQFCNRAALSIRLSAEDLCLDKFITIQAVNMDDNDFNVCQIMNDTTSDELASTFS